MPVSVDYSRDFNKQLEKAPLEIKIAFRRRRALYFTDEDHPLLHNHQLTGQYAGCRSINITGDWRAVFMERTVGSEKSIIFVAIGTHNQLYR